MFSSELYGYRSRVHAAPIIMRLSAVALTTLVGSASATTCDVYAAAGTPCVAAHSVVRSLYASYAGPLYLVKRNLDNVIQAIGVESIGGYANTALQDAFCGASGCTIVQIFDQSPLGNHLGTGPPGGAGRKPDRGVNATKLPLKVGGHSVYGAYFEPGCGYRNDNTTGIATGDEPESMYMVTSGRHYNSKCCFGASPARTHCKESRHRLAASCVALIRLRERRARCS